MTGWGRSCAAAIALGLAAACATPVESPDESATPSRVVVLAPSAAEMLVALGLADRVVAVGAHGPWPEQIEGVESVGSFDRPNLERILELEADLVLTTASVIASDSYHRLEQLGVAVEPLDTSTYEGVFVSLLRTGELFDRELEAGLIENTMRSSLVAVTESTHNLRKKSVLFVVGRDPLYVAGPQSHLGTLIKIGGGSNVAHNAASPYQQYSIEAVLQRGPEVILDMSGSADYWSQWPFLPAVENGYVHQVEPADMAIPGMRLPEMAKMMARLIHPEEFSGDSGSR